MGPVQDLFQKNNYWFTKPLTKQIPLLQTSRRCRGIGLFASNKANPQQPSLASCSRTEGSGQTMGWNYWPRRPQNGNCDVIRSCRSVLICTNRDRGSDLVFPELISWTNLIQYHIIHASVEHDRISYWNHSTVQSAIKFFNLEITFWIRPSFLRDQVRCTDRNISYECLITTISISWHQIYVIWWLIKFAGHQRVELWCRLLYGWFWGQFDSSMVSHIKYVLSEPSASISCGLRICSWVF